MSSRLVGNKQPAANLPNASTKAKTDLQKLKFPKKLAVMLRHETCLQRCGPDGFQVTDWEKFKSIMPKYFTETTKLASFKRQLNIYKFDKVVGATNAWRHDHFVVGNYEEIDLIVRGINSNLRKESAPPRTPTKKRSLDCVYDLCHSERDRCSSQTQPLPSETQPAPTRVSGKENESTLHSSESSLHNKKTHEAGYKQDRRPELYRLKQRPRREATFCADSANSENIPTTPTPASYSDNDDRSETDILPPGKRTFSFLLEPQTVKPQHSLCGIELDRGPVILRKTSFSNSCEDLPDVL